MNKWQALLVEFSAVTGVKRNDRQGNSKEDAMKPNPKAKRIATALAAGGVLGLAGWATPVIAATAAHPCPPGAMSQKSYACAHPANPCSPCAMNRSRCPEAGAKHSMPNPAASKSSGMYGGAANNPCAAKNPCAMKNPCQMHNPCKMNPP